MNIKLKSRRTAKLDSFKGFDFSSSRIGASPEYGVLGKNFICRNGVNSKRHGYNEILRISRLQSGEIIYPRIDSIFQFSLEGTKFIICYADRHFFQIIDNMGSYYAIDITFTSSKQDCTLIPLELERNKLFMFKNSGAVYFVGAGKLISFKKYNTDFELRYVEDNEDVYVPLTTKDISPVGQEDTSIKYESRNVLSSKRKNHFVPQSLLSHQSERWQLDTDYVDLGKDFIINIQYDYNDRVVTDVFRKDSNNRIISDLSGWDFGEITQSGELTLTNTEDALSNIISMMAEFSTAPSSMIDRINRCKIGTLFGVNGRMDRLFIAKNGIINNEDYMSESDNFGYFKEDDCVSKIGTEDCEIMAYTLLNDGTLAIQKQSVRGEASIFYRTSTYKTDFKQNGEISYIETYFPLISGSIGEGVISSYAMANLGEEKLFLGRNGVFSLVHTNNPSTNNLYARERSYFINNKLLSNKNLSDAFAIVYDNKYYLAINNQMFIGDLGHFSKTQNSQYNFDWWYWDNIPSTCMQVVDNDLWFGTDDGRICAFDDTFTDKTYLLTEEGDMLIDYQNNKVIFNQDILIEDGTNITLNSNVFARLIESSEASIINDRIYAPKEKFYMIKNNTPVYLGYNEEYILCYIKNIDYTDFSFELSVSGNAINIADTDFVIDIPLRGQGLKIKVENGENKLTMEHNDYVLTLTQSPLTNNMVRSKILIKKNVVAEWFTPMLDFGTMCENKTLLKLSFTSNSSSGKKIYVGYNTKSSSKSIQSKTDGTFETTSLDFTNFTFLTSFASSYTVDVKEDFNYLQLYIKSDSDSDCTLENISVVYKLNRYNRGVE